MSQSRLEIYSITERAVAIFKNLWHFHPHTVGLYMMNTLAKFESTYKNARVNCADKGTWTDRRTDVMRTTIGGINSSFPLRLRLCRRNIRKMLRRPKTNKRNLNDRCICIYIYDNLYQCMDTLIAILHIQCSWQSCILFSALICLYEYVNIFFQTH